MITSNETPMVKSCFSFFTELIPDEHSRVCELLENMGMSSKGLSCEDVLLIAQAGSHLYGLKTRDSDVDYVVIYREPLKVWLRLFTEKNQFCILVFIYHCFNSHSLPPQQVICNCHTPTESTESRGPEKAVEYGMYEARLLTEMLWKGSVVMLEVSPTYLFVVTLRYPIFIDYFWTLCAPFSCIILTWLYKKSGKYNFESHTAR